MPWPPARLQNRAPRARRPCPRLPRIPRKVFHKLLLNFIWWGEPQGPPDGAQFFQREISSASTIRKSLNRLSRAHFPNPESTLEQSDGNPVDGYYCLETCWPSLGARERGSCFPEDVPPAKFLRRISFYIARRHNDFRVAGDVAMG